MARRRYVWLLSLPLAAIGWIAGHSLAYVLVAPHAGHREQLLSETGHGYLGVAPLLVACAITVLLAGLALAIGDGVRDRARARVAVWPIALVPPLGFAVQEHLERAIELNAFPLGVALEPTFLVGMALQLPLAAVALLVAHAVLAFGHALGRRASLGRALRPSAREPQPLPPVRHEPVLRRPPILAGGHGQRAPPAPAVA
ncbi:MAG: hypothetical protein ACRDPC_12160 [Solirubrobacteraceae bacterium]